MKTMKMLAERLPILVAHAMFGTLLILGLIAMGTDDPAGPTRVDEQIHVVRKMDPETKLKAQIDRAYINDVVNAAANR